MSIHVKNNGLWTEVSNPQVKHNGVWKTPDKIYVKDAGVWKEVYSKTIQPVLWNKLGSDIEVQNSEIGGNGSFIVSPTYAAGEFGNGTEFTPANTQDVGVVFPLSLQSTQWTVEGWFKPYESSQPPDTNRSLFQLSYPGKRILPRTFSTSSVLVIWVESNNTTYNTSVSWNANELFHLAISMENDNTLKVYKDGALTDTITIPAQDVTYNNITIGNFNETNDSGIADGGIGWRPLNGLIDNIKVYDQTKTDFSDRYYEDGNQSLILHNTLGSQYEIENSIVGPNGYFDNQEGEMSFDTGKFGNGLKYTGVSNGVFRCKTAFDTSSILVNDVGCIEFWWKAGYTSGDSNYGNMYKILFSPSTTIYHPPAPVFNTGDGTIQLANDNYYSTRPDFTVSIGAKNKTVVNFGTSPDPMFTAGELMHLAITYNINGITGQNGKTVILYKNGVEVASTTSTWSVGTVKALWIGQFGRTSYDNDVREIGYSSAFGVYDNFKIWNYDKTDFSDRFVE